MNLDELKAALNEMEQIKAENKRLRQKFATIKGMLREFGEPEPEPQPDPEPPAEETVAKPVDPPKEPPKKKSEPDPPSQPPSWIQKEVSWH